MNRCGGGCVGGGVHFGVFQFLRLRVPQFQIDNEGFRRFCFVMVLNPEGRKTLLLTGAIVWPSVWTNRPFGIILFYP